MAFVSDTMTDTDTTVLSSHTGETGASWTLHTSYSGTQEIDTNRLRSTDGTTSAYYASGTPATAEYDIAADFYHANNSGLIGINGRMSTSVNTFYHSRWFNGNYQLYKFVAGTPTQLGIDYARAFSSAATDAMLFEIRDASKKVYIDTVERISSTNNDITAAGRVGTRSATNGLHLDNIVATDVSAGATATLTGTSATGSAGTLTATGAANVPLTGASATGSAGTLTISASALAEITGIAATASAGSLTATGGAVALLSGVSATASAGILTVDVAGGVTVTLTGVGSTGSAGTLTATGGATVDLTGTSATGSAGTLAMVLGQTVQLTGISATAVAGILDVTGGATASLTGVSATGSAGTITISTDLATVVIPGYRTYLVEHEDRTYLVLAEDKTLH